METIQVAKMIGDKRTGVVRWAVLATFAQSAAGHSACIEYRVRVVEEQPGTAASWRAARQVLREMGEEAPTDGNVAAPIPASGIPRYVFELASQTRLLRQWQDRLRDHPNLVPPLSPKQRKLLEPAPGRSGGRPPVRPLAEKLRILAEVEKAYSADETLDQVARRHRMSRSSVRDLLRWARYDAEPRLFTVARPGVREGALTPEARALLAAQRESLEGN